MSIEKHLAIEAFEKKLNQLSKQIQLFDLTTFTDKDVKLEIYSAAAIHYRCLELLKKCQSFFLEDPIEEIYDISEYHSKCKDTIDLLPDACEKQRQELLNNPKELYDELSKIEPTDGEYVRIKEVLMCLDKTQEMLKNWTTDHYKRENIIKLDEIKLAAYYYFNHNCSYGPGYLGWGSSVYLNDKKWKSMIDKIKDFKCEKLKVEQLSFEKSIIKHKEDFLYLDPPYFLEKDSDNKMHKGMYPMKNIDVHHSGFNHELLRDLLLSHEGDFVLSYNNCETIREYYKDFDFYFPEWNYSMSNGEKRIGKNRIELNNSEIVKKSHEILIVKRRD